MFLPGSNKQVEVNILRDTGALDSFVRTSLLPFSADTDTGRVVAVRGMGLVPIFAPLHKMNITCGLVSGEIVVALRPELRMEGVDIILGNDLAGNRVWPDHMVGGELRAQGESELPEESEGSPVCAVTWAMSKKCLDFTLVVPTLLESIPHKELV